MEANNDQAVALGLWECGHCHGITDQTHFYMDLATGEMQHEADEHRRAAKARQCGWRFNDGMESRHYRCGSSVGHHSPHMSMGAFPVTFSGDHSGAIPPYDPNSASAR